MTAIPFRRIWPNLGLAALLVLPVIMGACDTTEPVGHDVRENHPIMVSQEDIQLAFPLPFSPNSLTPNQQLELNRFIVEYQDRGRSAVLVEIIGAEGSAAQWQGFARDVLLKAGLRENEISLLSGSTPTRGAAMVRFTFVANAVKVPKCGDDFRVGSSYNPTNRLHSEYGCAVQRNLGLMIQDPGDLLRAQPMTPGDPNRATLIIRANQSPRAIEETGESAEE